MNDTSNADHAIDADDRDHTGVASEPAESNNASRMLRAEQCEQSD